MCHGAVPLLWQGGTGRQRGRKKALLGAAERTFARPLSFFKEKVVDAPLSKVRVESDGIDPINDDEEY